MVIAAGDREPAGDQPVELLDMAQQRGVAGIVPRRREGDGERLVLRRIGAAPQPLGIAQHAADRSRRMAGEIILAQRMRSALGGERQLVLRHHREDGRAEADRGEDGEQHERRQCDAEAPPPAPGGIEEDGRLVQAIAACISSVPAAHVTRESAPCR